jgi:hypothetical protein
MPNDFDSECFFIAPIGENGSDIRKRSDGVRDWVVKPAAKEAAGLKTLRADDVGEPGQITAQAVQHCLKAKAAVADLTDGNPNVYYELSVRHGALLPVALIAEAGTKLPFDVSQSRVIFFDHTDLSSAGRAMEELRGQIEASLSGTPDNPISDGMRLAQLQAGNVEEQTLAIVLDRLQRLSHATEQIDKHLRRTDRRQEIAERTIGERLASLGAAWWPSAPTKEQISEMHTEEAPLFTSEEIAEIRAASSADRSQFEPPDPQDD